MFNLKELLDQVVVDQLFSLKDKLAEVQQKAVALKKAYYGWLRMIAAAKKNRALELKALTNTWLGNNADVIKEVAYYRPSVAKELRMLI